jgi:phospholipase/carboxylesterase
MRPIETALVHRILLPADSSPARHPALVMLHGRGTDEEDLLGLAEALDPRFLIISPRAPFPFPGAGYTWYDAGADGAPEPAGFMSSYAALRTFLDDVLRSYPIDPARLFLFGFSMGTVMSYALALTAPELFRGVVANSGYLAERTPLTYAWEHAGSLEFLITHGTEDPVIPLAAARHAADVFHSRNVPVTAREYLMGHAISGECLADAAAWLHRRIDQQP